MSDLQISLLVIGAVVVVAVLLFNRLQERRFRNQAEAAFRMPAESQKPVGSVAHDLGQRVEPALHEPASGDALHAVSPSGTSAAHRTEPAEAGGWTASAPAPDGMAYTAHPEEPPAAPAARAAVSRVPTPKSAAPAPYDELIEYRVRIGSDSVAAHVFADAFNQGRSLGKAVRWLALPVGATEWEDIQPWRDVHYQQIIVTLQLADRNGAIQDDQLTALCAQLQTVAQTHGLRIACDDTVDALERAQAIDRFCVDVDVLIGLNVVARGEGAVNLERIVREAESNGMVLGMDGVFQLLDSRSEPLYALCNHDAEPFSATVIEGQVSQGVTLQFDVPRVPDGVKVFDSMVAFGRKLANEVGGILVDDNQRPLTDTGIDKIRSQLLQIYERMEARGVPSGSRRALRLFS